MRVSASTDDRPSVPRVPWGRSHLSWDVERPQVVPTPALPSLSLQSRKPVAPAPSGLDNRQHPRLMALTQGAPPRAGRGPPHVSQPAEILKLRRLCSPRACWERAHGGLDMEAQCCPDPALCPQAASCIQAGLWLLPPRGPAPHKPASPRWGVQRASCCPRTGRRPAER